MIRRYFEVALINGWTGGDGWHECPRHTRVPVRAASRAVGLFGAWLTPAGGAGGG